MMLEKIIIMLTHNDKTVPDVIMRNTNTMKCFELNEGDIILVEEGEPHELTNIGMGPAVITWSCAPSHIK